MKQILVIGSEGFIGSNLTRYFLAKDCLVTGIDMGMGSQMPGYRFIRVLNFDYALDDVLNGTVPDCCIFAGGSANIALSFTQPHADFQANTSMIASLLSSLRKINPSCRFVHFSSAAVYGNPKSLPVHESSALAPISPYGWHKMYAEQICREYHEQYGIHTCSIRPFSVYGPGQKKLLFWDIYQKALTGNVELFGDGSESRDFIHIGDLMRLTELIATKAPMKGEAYNAAWGEETRIDLAASVFLELMPQKATLRFNGKSKQGDPKRWVANVSAVHSLGFEPELKLQEGLQNYYSWLRENG